MLSSNCLIICTKDLNIAMSQFPIIVQESFSAITKKAGQKQLVSFALQAEPACRTQAVRRL